MEYRIEISTIGVEGAAEMIYAQVILDLDLARLVNFINQPVKAKRVRKPKVDVRQINLPAPVGSEA